MKQYLLPWQVPIGLERNHSVIEVRYGRNKIVVVKVYRSYDKYRLSGYAGHFVCSESGADIGFDTVDAAKNHADRYLKGLGYVSVDKRHLVML